MNEIVRYKDFFNQDQVELIKSSICKGASNDELRWFLYQCARARLDPFARQIYWIKRRDGTAFTLVSIDGFRLIAHRSGDYDGQVGPEWADENGSWHSIWLEPGAPAAARVGVLRKGSKNPTWGVARFISYAPRGKDGKLYGNWESMPDVMIAKCFDDKTQILTERGFRRFSEVGDLAVMMVADGSLVAVEAKPFARPYRGQMVTYESDDINFSVTPNHDMITTFGKVEASALYQTSHQRGPWRIPRIVVTNRFKNGQDRISRLIGYVLADGYRRNEHWAIAISRPDKIQTLRELGLQERELTQRTAGQSVVVASGRTITTNFDKAVFAYPSSLISGAVDERKQLRRDFLLSCTSEQARAIVDAWQDFDGHTNKKTGVRRVYMSDLDRLDSFELLAVKAGYAVSGRKSRQSDIGGLNWALTLSDRDDLPVFRHSDSERPSLQLTPYDAEVWCVTVPSGAIVVRREGFSMLCGNCAEALALRKAFPQDLSGLYSGDEMQQAIPDSQRELLDKENMGGREGPVTEGEQHKREVESDSNADAVIEKMQSMKDHNALYVYKSTALAKIWKDFFPPDRERIQAEYTRLMKTFADKVA